MDNQFKNFETETDDNLMSAIINYKLRPPLANVYAYIELHRRRNSIIKKGDILSILKKFAAEKGFESWELYLNDFLSRNQDIQLEHSENEGTSTSSTSSNTHDNLEIRYPALRTISGVITFIAWTIAVLTIIIVLVLFSSFRGEGSWTVPVSALAIGAVFFIGLLAYAEIIKVLVDIEENTRRTASK